MKCNSIKSPRVKGRPSTGWLNRPRPPFLYESPVPVLDRRLLAYHEAGHLVMCLTFGIGARRAWINEGAGGVTLGDAYQGGELARWPSIGAEGGGSSEDIHPAVMKAAAIQLATMYVAGHAAVLMVKGLFIEGTLCLSDRDHTNAKFVLRDTFGDTHNMYYCQRLAMSLLAERWPLVEDFAARLQFLGVLTKCDIDVVSNSYDPVEEIYPWACSRSARKQWRSDISRVQV